MGTFKIGAYNCEGFLSALPYVSALFMSCNVLFLAETWLSESEQNTMMHMLDNGSDDLFCIQSFAMELPPGAGAGRRHGGVALICKRQSGLTFREISCDDARLCGVTLCNVNTPVVTILGCYYERARSAKRVSTDIHQKSEYERPAGRGHAFERLISLEP